MKGARQDGIEKHAVHHSVQGNYYDPILNNIFLILNQNFKHNKKNRKFHIRRGILVTPRKNRPSAGKRQE